MDVFKYMRKWRPWRVTKIETLRFILRRRSITVSKRDYSEIAT
jgi:hypothetical protein